MIMSTLKVIVVKIEKVLPHPDPETIGLDLIPINGWCVLVKKGTFSVGNGNMTVKSTGSIAAKDLNLTDSTGTVYVLTGDLIKKLISL